MTGSRYASQIFSQVATSWNCVTQSCAYSSHSGGQLYLLGYTLDDGVRLIYLEAVGPHENFYRDLKL